MNGLTRVPRVGVHVFMTARVFWTIFEFFLSYLVEIFGFAIVFHILLPQGKTVLLNPWIKWSCKLYLEGKVQLIHFYKKQTI
jgi:hypothetical protein